MARSIRSKRGRKLRAFKRIRYGEKELNRLKTMLQNAAEEEKLVSSQTTSSHTTESLTMDCDQTNQKELQVNTKPSKYPSWLSHFKIRKLAKVEKKRKQKEAKRLKKELKKSSHKKGKKK